MKNLARHVFVVSLIFASSILKADEPDKKLHSNCIYPTVKLEILAGGCGSGVIVRSSKKDEKAVVYTNVIVTAAHNLNNGPLKVCVSKYQNWSTCIGYDRFDSTVFSSSKKYDLAILFFESPTQMPVAEIDFGTKYFIGSKIFKMGYGVTDECRLDTGEITAVSTFEPIPFFGHIRINAHTIFGDSGGPCYLGSNYKVIGITKAIRGFKDQFVFSHVYISPIEWLKVWNVDSQNTLLFVYDSTIPIPLTVADVQKRNVLLHLKTQLQSTSEDIESKKVLKDSLEKEINKIEDGAEIAPPVPN